MGTVPKNGFCYISVNKILKMTSQYNASLGSLRNYPFPSFSVLKLHRLRLHCTLLQIPIATKLTQLVVMSCLPALFPTLHLLTALSVFIKMMWKFRTC